MPASHGNIEIYMGPESTGGPDDLKQVIIDFINGAKKKLEIAVQELDNADIAHAIVDARLRGVQVRLVVELDYLRESKPLTNPWTPNGSLEPNRVIQNAIYRAAIRVNSDFNTKIFHQKFIIRDGNAVLTGSTNFTDTGVERNLNHLVIIRDKKVANTYTKEFAEIRQGHFGKRDEGHDETPRDVTVSDIPVRILFAPDHNPEMEIMKQMAKARKRVDFAIFTFAKSSGIDDQMILLSKHAGVPVTGALDGRQANQKWAATRPVKNAGATLFRVSSSAAVGKLHHKLMVIDEQVIIGGSFNYTGPANNLNDENIFILGDLESPAGPSKNAQKKLAKFALKEINRIIADHGAKIN